MQRWGSAQLRSNYTRAPARIGPHVATPLFVVNSVTHVVPKTLPWITHDCSMIPLAVLFLSLIGPALYNITTALSSTKSVCSGESAYYCGSSQTHKYVSLSSKLLWVVLIADLIM